MNVNSECFVRYATLSLLFEVPQGWVLGPALLTMYSKPVGITAQWYGATYHLYADDITKWWQNEYYIYMASPYYTKLAYLQLGESSISPTDLVQILGVIFGKCIDNVKDCVTSVYRVAYYHLKNF